MSQAGEHIHHDHPSRCCPDEPAEQVVAKLRAAPPQRMGYSTPHGWSGEAEEAFRARLGAWEAALAREEALAKE